MRAVETAFVPGSGTERAFRDALGRFATGVTVVTCRDTGGAAVGITANSFASVSLDPPLVLWSAARASTRFGPFSTAERWAIHVLGEEQHDLARRFTRGGAGFEGLELVADDDDAAPPAIAGTLVRFDCRCHARHDGGDHLILVGEVTRITERPGAPLVFAQGSFGMFRG